MEIEIWVIIWVLVLGAWSLCFSAAGLDAYPADMVAESERFGEDLELFKASEVIEVFASFLDGPGGADGDADPARTAVLRQRGIGSKGKVC